MNLSLNWLRELVDFDLTAEELAHKLTFAGLEIEAIEPAGDDTLLVAEVTTNRPDWLCHIGVAREIAALTGSPVQFPEIALDESGPDVNTLTSVTVEEDATDYCPRYTARVIQGVKVGPSPEWLKKRLEALGQRSINNIVDITNLVMFETNEPLHAFDYDLLKENRIIVRRAQPGEPFTAITGESGKLTPDQLVIADAERAVALAGVKGGAETEVHDGTVNVLLEAAYFQQQQVRRASRATRMDSESSYRFERGVDPGGVERASARAAHLICELAGGTLAKGVIDSNPDLAQPREVTMRLDYCARILGMHMEPHEVERTLRCLGVEVIKRDAVGVHTRVPTFRQDLTREADLIEEVIRVHGFDHLPSEVTMPLDCAHQPPAVTAARTGREALVGLGYHECYTDAFVRERWEAACRLWGGEPLRILNPVNAERPLLRTSLVPSLLEVRRNNRGQEDVRLFEMGHVYLGGTNKDERQELGLLDDRGVEYVRGAFETILHALRVEGDLVVAPADIPGLQTGTSAELRMGDTVLAVMGLADAQQVQLHDLDAAPAVLEARFDRVAALPRRALLYTPLPRFPAVRRDIALVVPEAVSWAEIEGRVREAAQQMESLHFESMYRGKGLKTGTKSVAFSMVFRAPERSLTDDEVNELRDAVVKHLTRTIETATLR